MDEKHRGKISKKAVSRSCEVFNKIQLSNKIWKEAIRRYWISTRHTSSCLLKRNHHQRGWLKDSCLHSRNCKMQENPAFEINSNVEDLYFNLERYLIEQNRT